MSVCPYLVLVKSGGYVCVSLFGIGKVRGICLCVLIWYCKVRDMSVCPYLGLVKTEGYDCVSLFGIGKVRGTCLCVLIWYW